MKLAAIELINCASDGVAIEIEVRGITERLPMADAYKLHASLGAMLAMLKRRELGPFADHQVAPAKPLAETTIGSVISALRTEVRARGWTINRLATEAGLAESSLRAFFSDDWNPRLKTLRAICAVIQ